MSLLFFISPPLTLHWFLSLLLLLSLSTTPCLLNSLMLSIPLELPVFLSSLLSPILASYYPLSLCFSLTSNYSLSFGCSIFNPIPTSQSLCCPLFLHCSLDPSHYSPLFFFSLYLTTTSKVSIVSLISITPISWLFPIHHPLNFRPIFLHTDPFLSTPHLFLLFFIFWSLLYFSFPQFLNYFISL